MNFLKFAVLLGVVGLIFSIIGYNFLLNYHNKHINIGIEEECEIIVKSKILMNGSIYINKKYTLGLAYDKDNNSLYRALKKGDLLKKNAASDSIFINRAGSYRYFIFDSY